ncbi:hypothetical protein [Mycetocola sp.]|uniref:hypothetical protein n=1 Tax=Mycetocola sp. TaxID=1871042 RepID=UPI00398949D5
MDRAGFDPRYSPEFQRGFDPSVHDGISAPTEPHERIEPVPDPITPVPKPVVRRVPPAPTDSSDQSAMAWADDMFRSADVPASERNGEEPGPSALPVSPWRNPYLVALTVAGVVLIAGGIGAFRWAVKQVFGGAVYESGATEEDMQEAMLAAQLAWGLSPLLALAGALTLLGVFFFAAWRWRPRRRHADDDPDAAPNGNSSN